MARGADSIEHVIAAGALSSELPDGLIELMLNRKTYVVPTLIATLKVSHHFKGWEKFDDLMVTIKRFYDAGVNIATGTDAGAPDVQFGEAVHEEMELMVKLGMSPMDVIVSSTKKAAEALGKENELGTIEQGKLADMIVVSGNPESNIADCKNIKLVMKDGKFLVDKLGLAKTYMIVEFHCLIKGCGSEFADSSRLSGAICLTSTTGYSKCRSNCFGNNGTIVSADRREA